MSKIIGKKIKMDQIFKDERVIPISIVKLDEAADISNFKSGELVKVSGVSKGHGFQGVVKRHGFSGGPKTRGQKNRLRAPGSIGSTAPQRVPPGRRMPGRMGTERVTIKNLEIVNLDADRKIVFLKGAIPGNKNGKIEISK
jgi:large subunit ribosomal protein L3